MKKIILIIIAATFVLVGCSNSTKEETKEVNIYTDRHYEIDKEIFDEFEKETGIKVNLVQLESAEVYSKLQSEGDAVADIVIMNGSEYIYKFNELDLLVNHDQDIKLDKQYYGENWAGFVARARSVAVSNDSELNITSYEDLASEDLKGQILVRSSSSAYNQSWVASMISLYGEEYTEEWLGGFVGNFARSPEGNDRDQIKAVNEGIGEVAIANSYYMNKLHVSTDESEVAASNSVTLASLDEIQLNVAWAGLIDKNDASIKLFNYLQTAEVQSKISLENGEYPLNESADINEYIEGLQVVNPQAIDYETFGKDLELAYEMMIEAGWN